MTRNQRLQLAEMGERWIRAWSRPDVSREDAAVMVTYWHLYEPTDPELVDEVLSRFSPAEPPAVAGLDFLAVEQDAKTIVAESSADAGVTTVRQRSLSEMVEAANAEAEKFNAEFPPGTRVEYWRGAREGKGRVSRTEGLAFATQSGMAAVFIVNTSGYIALSHVRPLIERAS